ncbi:MAG: hypothetical protein JXJ22_18695 [Bacteroidales bacterium]|nr:hypothetical protein [Bacteroidales bacterium]
MKTSEITKKEIIHLFPFFVLFIILIISVLQHSFFWDKDILESKQAYWYLNNGFSIIPPAELDAGHPPLMGLVLAFLWKLFGKNLAVGHLLMLPFALGITWQMYRFLKFLFQESDWIYTALLLILLDTSLLTQMVVVSGDLILVFFFFLSLNSILSQKKFILALSMVGLGLISMRGMLSCAIIGIFHLYYTFLFKKDKLNFSNLTEIIISYIPAFVLSLAYLIYHYSVRGWITFDPEDSNWAGCYERVDINGFIRNIFILIWRLVDFGRLGLWLIGFYFLIKFFHNKIMPDRNIKLLLVLFLISLVVYSPGMLFYKVLSAHRYILPVYMIFGALISYLIFNTGLPAKTMKILFYFALIVLLSGNFWVYPDHIAKGWDATLAHLPYYSLRNKMISYIDEHHIPISEIGSDTPNNSEFKYIDLKGDERAFPKKDLQAQKYIFYSNILNGFTDEELKKLKNSWQVVQQYRFLQVRVTLYKNPYYSK